MHDLLNSLGKKSRCGIVKECVVCKKSFYLRQSAINKNNYCSKVCKNRALLKGDDLSCKYCGKKYHRSPSMIRLRGSSYCSNQCKGLYMSKNQKGKSNISWKGGVSKKSKRIRSSKKWKIWRFKVFTRDNWKCQNCGKTGYLEPHHIKPFALFPKLRFVIKNGLTLCRNCHREITAKQYVRKNKVRPS